jgi:hypothetical protein
MEGFVMLLEGTEKLFLIDRFRHGKKLAEGAKVFAKTEKEAIQKAKALFVQEDSGCCQAQYVIRA